AMGRSTARRQGPQSASAPRPEPAGLHPAPSFKLRLLFKEQRKGRGAGEDDQRQTQSNIEKHTASGRDSGQRRIGNGKRSQHIKSDKPVSETGTTYKAPRRQGQRAAKHHQQNFGKGGN